MDTLSAAVRNRIIARIKTKDTAPEMAMRRAMRTAGLRFRLLRGDLLGTPDLVFPRYRAAVFVHGCF
jgi:DNA mismatch endonuclease (patch repair protein)